MQIFRTMIRSRVGKTIALGVVVIAGVAFAVGDVLNTGSVTFFGGKSDTVAKIGGRKLTTEELQARVQRVFERFRQEQPELTMAQFLAEGSVKQITDQLVSNLAVMEYGERHGMRISKKLVDAEISRNTAFADATGVFSQSVFQQALQREGITEKQLRDDIAAQLMRQHLLSAAAAGSKTPEAMVKPYSAMLIEQRTGEAIGVPSATFAPKTPPTDAVLKRFYDTHPADFTIPELRKLRYVVIARDRFTSQATPTDAEIAQAYKAQISKYEARDARDFTQLILPTQSQAKDVAAKASSGQDLAEIARTIGLSVSRIQDVDKAAFTTQTNADVAKAGFAAAKGALVGPIRSPLGWAVIKVDDVRTIAAKSLEQVKGELIPQIQTEKEKQLFADYLSKIDGKIGEGQSLAVIAKADNLTIVETPQISAQGRSPRDPAFQPDGVVSALLKPGFSMSADDDPQVVAVRPDEVAAILAVGDILPSGPPPFAQIKQAVVIGWSLDQGKVKAREAARKLTDLLNKGEDPAKAIAAAGITDAPRQPIAQRRAQINGPDGKPSPPLAALFTMKPGTARTIELEANRGFMVVRLEKVIPEDPSGNQQLLESTRAGLANVLGSEYATQTAKAIEKELGVTRDEKAIASVEAALIQANSSAQ